MDLGDPRFDLLPKLLGFLNDLGGLHVANCVRRVIVQGVSLSTAGLEVCGESRNIRPDGQLGRLERSLMGTEATHAIARTGNRDLGELQGCVIGRRESTIIRETCQSRVDQIPLHDASQGVQFLLARRVRSYAITRQELLPGHSGHPECRSSRLSKQSRENDVLPRAS